jgi:hypothetical protein
MSPSTERYDVDELSFEVPEGYVDESVNVFLSPAAAGHDVNVVVTREPRTGDPLARQVASILQTARGKVPALKILGHRECALGTVPGYEARAHGMSNKKPIYQRQIYAAWYDTLVCFTVTAGRAQSAHCESIVEQVKGSLRLRKRS